MHIFDLERHCVECLSWNADYSVGEGFVSFDNCLRDCFLILEVVANIIGVWNSTELHDVNCCIEADNHECEEKDFDHLKLRRSKFLKIVDLTLSVRGFMT